MISSLYNRVVNLQSIIHQQLLQMKDNSSNLTHFKLLELFQAELHHPYYRAFESFKNAYSIQKIFYSCDKDLFLVNQQGHLMSTTSSKQVLVSNLIPYEVS